MEIEQPFYQCLSYKLSALLIFSSKLKSSLNVISHSEKEEQCRKYVSHFWKYLP